MSKTDYLIGIGAIGIILIYVVFICILIIASWFIGGYITTQYFHFNGWLWWASTLLIMMIIWGLMGVGSNQIRKTNKE